ncbi:MAG: hypothetical protein IJ155_04415 [Prevotella sp.]|nr:hypothetical protein [Prevotella sp.]
MYFYKKQYPQLSIEQVKAAVTEELNSLTQETIREGFVWNGHKVWLSQENQLNYKSDFDLALQTGGENLPVTFKFGTDAEPDYYTFERVDELKDFWMKAKKHINTAIEAGWKTKDGIDWSEYEKLLVPDGNASGTIARKEV